MGVDVPWKFAVYGVDLAWYCGANEAAIPNNANDAAYCRYRRANEILTLQILVIFGTGVIAALAAAGAGAWKLELPALSQPIGIPWVLQGYEADITAGLPDPAAKWLAASSPGETPENYVRGVVPPGTEVSNTAPFTWAVGDSLVVNGSIEAFAN